MDERTRGYMEAVMDELLEDEKIVEEVTWVQEEIPVSSLRDLSIGYAIGALKAFGWSVNLVRPRGKKRASGKEIEKTIITLIKRRLPEILRIIERELHR